MKDKKILVIEDEEEMAQVIQDNLEYDGYNVIVAKNGECGLSKSTKENPDLIILDVMLPKKDGWEICREIRAINKQIPILFLTARGSEIDRVLGLEMGGDDYLCKPFSIREFLARVKSLLRRSSYQPGISLHIGDNEIDLDRFLIKNNRGEHVLSHYEVEILKMLLTNTGKPIHRNDILSEIWGIDNYPSNRTVDNYIVKLRKKIEKDVQNPQYIFTIHGFGYKLIQ